MEGIFGFRPDATKYKFSDVMIDLSTNEDFIKFLQENDGVHLTADIKETSKYSEKERLYAYYHRVVLQAAVIGFSRHGYEFMDKYKADYKLKAECATSTMIGPDGKEEPYLEDKSSMSKQRLLKYVQDCILFIEMHLETEVPDSEEWKSMQLTGRKFKSVKYLKE